MIDAARLDAARRARRSVIAERSTDDITTVLVEAAAVWARADSAPRANATASLYEALPLSPQMTDHGLDCLFGSVSPDAIAQLIARQVEAPNVLGAVRSNSDGVDSAYVGPDTVFHSLAGNVPGLSVPALVCAVLARSVTIIRDSARQPVLTQAFAETITAIDPLVGRLIVIATPATRARDVRASLGNEALRIELHGSDAVVDTLADEFSDAFADTPAGTSGGLPTTKHGSRISAVIATPDAKAADWANAIAHDVVMYEGLGCLTPHTVFVEGQTDIEHWCTALATALDERERMWPRHRQSMSLEAQRRAFLEQTSVSGLVGGATVAAHGANDCWCVIRSPDAMTVTNSAPPGMRCVLVVATDDRQHTLGAVRAMSSPVAGLGLTMSDTAIQNDATLNALASDSGASLVCRAGEMQSPPLHWEQDGSRRLGDLLDWRTLRA